MKLSWAMKQKETAQPGPHQDDVSAVDYAHIWWKGSKNWMNVAGWVWISFRLDEVSRGVTGLH